MAFRILFLARILLLSAQQSRKKIHLPGFSTPFTVLASNAQLTHAELIRAVRFLIASEYEAVQLYTQLAESTDHKVATQIDPMVAIRNG